MSRPRKIVFDAPVRGRDFQEPRFSRGVHRFTLLAGRTYLRLFEGVDTISVSGADHIIDEFQRFHQGGSRLLIVFRHAAKEDAPVLAYTFDRIIPQLMRRERRGRLGFIPHVRFLYGKDVLNWAGRAAVWLFPRMGNIPVVNRGMHKQGLTILKDELRRGTFPIALAPEAQVTYHMYHCTETEKGAAVLATWAMDSGLPVQILPISLRYHYSDDPFAFTVDIVRRWEEETGEPLGEQGAVHRLGGDREYDNLVRVLLTMTAKSLSLLEHDYRITPDPRPSASSGSPDGRSSSEEIDWLRDRISRLNESILQAAEDLSGIEAEGSWLDRVFRIRYHGMARLYPESFDPARLPPLARHLADFRSLEARIYLRHSQIVDVLEYLDPAYLFSSRTPEAHAMQVCSESEGIGDRVCEYGLILLDLINRMAGGNIDTRYTPPHKRVRVIAGEAIDVRGILLTEAPDSAPAEQDRVRSGNRARDKVGLLHREIDRRLVGLSDPTL